MQLAKVKKIVDRRWKKIAWELGLDGWAVKWEYEGCSNPKHSAEVYVNATYQQATVTIDPDRMIDEADVLDTIIHELCHVVHGPFELFWRLGVQVGAADRYDLWFHACEQTRLIMQRAYGRLKTRWRLCPGHARDKNR